jgi:hypothetical protein
VMKASEHDLMLPARSRKLVHRACRGTYVRVVWTDERSQGRGRGGARPAGGL